MAHESNEDENSIWDKTRKVVGFFTMFQEVRYYLAACWYKIVTECPDWVEHANITKQQPRKDILDLVLEWQGDPDDPPLYPVGPIKPPPGNSFKPLHNYAYDKANASYRQAFDLCMTPGKFRECLAFILSEPSQFYSIPYDQRYASEVTWTAYNVLTLFAGYIARGATVDSMDVAWTYITGNVNTGVFPPTTAGEYGAAYQWWQCCFESPDWVLLAKTTGMTVSEGNKQQAWQWVWNGEDRLLPGPGEDPATGTSPPPNYPSDPLPPTLQPIGVAGPVMVPLPGAPISLPGHDKEDPQPPVSLPGHDQPISMPVGLNPQVCTHSAQQLMNMAPVAGQGHAAWEYIQTQPAQYYTGPLDACTPYAFGVNAMAYYFVRSYVQQEGNTPDILWQLGSTLVRAYASGDVMAMCAVANTWASLAESGDYAAWAKSQGWAASQTTWAQVNAAMAPCKQ